MKHMLNIGLIILAVSTCLSINCSRKSIPLADVFSNSELIEVNKIIKFYDDFVVSKTNDHESIEKAYMDFFDKKLDVDQINIDSLRPSFKERISLYKKLDPNVLSEFFQITDSVWYYKGQPPMQRIKVQVPYSFILNNHGKYMLLLENLSKRNDFLKNYYESAARVGDLGPSNYSAILKNFNKFDFSKKEERLIVIINLLHYQNNIIK